MPEHKISDSLFFVAFLLRRGAVIAGIRSVIMPARTLLTTGGNDTLPIVIAGRIKNTHFLLLADSQ